MGLGSWYEYDETHVSNCICEGLKSQLKTTNARIIYLSWKHVIYNGPYIYAKRRLCSWEVSYEILYMPKGAVLVVEFSPNDLFKSIQ